MQFLMMLTGPGEGGKSYVIYAVLQYCKAFSLGAGVNFVTDSFLVSACSNSAAILICGKTIPAMCHFNISWLQGQGQGCQWRNVKYVIIDVVSSFTCNELQKLDKQFRCLTGNWAMLFGGLHVMCVGFYFQVAPVYCIPLNGLDYATHCKHANNACVYLDVSHRYKNDSKWSDILSRMRLGHTTQEDISTLNTLVFGK